MRGEEELSRLWVFGKRMRIGASTVTIGGIAGVGTSRKHRGKGYASRIMEDSTALMYEQGFEMGWLFGIQDFYHRYGYAVASAETRLHIRTEDLRGRRASLRVRAMRKADVPAIRRLYGRLNSRRTGTVLRPPGWSGFEISPGFRDPGPAMLATRENGRIRGYVTFSLRDDRLVVGEAAALDPPSADSLVFALGNRARRARAERLAFHLPSDDLLVPLSTGYGYWLESVHPRNGGSMGRIVHFDNLMHRLVPELSQRASRVGLKWRGNLVIETDLGSALLAIRGGEVSLGGPRTTGSSRVRVPQAKLTQLLMGYRRVRDVAQDPGVHIPSRLYPVMEALFPAEGAYMWWSDRF